MTGLCQLWAVPKGWRAFFLFFFFFFFLTLHIYSKSSLVKLDIHEHENLSLMSRLKPQLYLTHGEVANKTKYKYSTLWYQVQL